MSSTSKGKKPQKSVSKPLSRSIITTRSAKSKTSPVPKIEHKLDEIMPTSTFYGPQPETSQPSKPKPRKRVREDDLEPRMSLQTSTDTGMLRKKAKIVAPNSPVKPTKFSTTMKTEPQTPPHPPSPADSVVIVSDNFTDKHIAILPPPPPPPTKSARGKYIWLPDSPTPTIDELLQTETIDDDVGNESENEDEDDEQTLDPIEEQSAHAKVILHEPVPNSSNIAGSSSTVVYMEDYAAGNVGTPSQCEIWQTFNSDPEFKALMDSELKPAYEGLPPLKLGSITSWNDIPASGLVMWRSWRQQLEDPDMEYYMTFMDFQRYRHFINPARVNPKLLTKVVASDGYLTTLALANENLCLCLSLVYVANSRLLSPHQTAGDKQIKSLDCIFHSYEWERATSLFCMLFGVDKLQAQLTNGTISIATRPTSNTIHTNISKSGLFSDTPSPSKRRIETRNTNKVKLQLNPTDEVPVYDGTNHIIDLHDGSIAQIGSSLPLLAHEMPIGSLALVAYTANAYKRLKGSPNVTNLALNINWAVLLANPLN